MIEIARKTVVQPMNKESVDHDVPEYISRPDALHPPERRGVFEVFSGHEAQKVIFQTALQRATFAAVGGQRPFVHFPNAEHIQHFPFYIENWLQFGDMEMEYNRIHFTLSHYPERAFPSQFFGVREGVRAGVNPNVLKQWKRGESTRIRKAEKVLARGIEQMYAARQSDYSNGFKGAHLAHPFLYQSVPGEGEQQKRLFDRASDQIRDELTSGDTSHLQTYLDLHAHLKDPITPVTSVLGRQTELFQRLLDDISENVDIGSLDLRAARRFVAQLAQESSFLTVSELSPLITVIHSSPHELPYISVDPKRLPRGEFANPHRVTEVIKEVLDDSAEAGEPVITPITVSYLQEPGKSPSQFIVDGNNRATAVLLMSLYAESGDDRDYVSHVHQFVRNHDLDIEWERDIAKTVQHITPELVEFMHERHDLVNAFANAHIPALLVQEPNFHTVAVQRSKPGEVRLLQPWHQVAYNQREKPMAIPSKQQSHGRAAGNDIRMSIQRL